MILSVPSDKAIAIGRDIAGGVTKQETKIHLDHDASILWDKMAKEIKEHSQFECALPWDGEDADFGGHFYRPKELTDKEILEMFKTIKTRRVVG